MLLTFWLRHVLRATTASAKWLHTRRFTEPAFQPSRATKHRKKHSVSQLFYLFAHLDLLSTESFSSLPLPTSAASSVHIVGSLTSNPSIKYMYMHMNIHIYIIIYIYISNICMRVCVLIYIYIYISRDYPYAICTTKRSSPFLARRPWVHWLGFGLGSNDVR